MKIISMTQYATTYFKIALFILTALLLTVPSSLQAQQKSGSDYEQFQQQLKNDYFSVGSLLQSTVDYQPERRSGENGFSIANARFKVYGTFDETFGYQLQANFLSTPSVLDANLYYNFNPNFSLKAGLFKSPFSYEYLTGAANIDFVNRSSAVNQLAPKRQIGFQLSGSTGDGHFRYKAGMFNGEGFGPNENADDNFLYVGRVETHFDTESQEHNIIWGVNAAYQQKDLSLSSGNLISRFRGDQTLLGTDLRYTNNELMLSGELLYSWLDSEIAGTFNPFGYHVTAGYYLNPKTQVLLRWDQFDNDNLVLAGDTQSLIAGLNYFPTSFSEIQLNYILPTDEAVKYSQLLLNLQINI